MKDLSDSYVHLVRLALEGRQQDVLTLVKRNIRQFEEMHPEISAQLKELLESKKNTSQALRKNIQSPLPVDIDSKLELIKKENIHFETPLVWSNEISNEINKIIEERKLEEKLISNGLLPTRSALFVGEPGVGKTLAAKWISSVLNRPLVTLDLAAVMSSYLGKTGTNIRAVLEYAKKNQCVLLLDEFDAIAKRRSDDSEIGELKRLVTVLLQEIDEWPASGLLIAATNHEELLDTAVWRRFDRIINFPKPSIDDLKYTIIELLKNDFFEDKEKTLEILAISFHGLSYADVTKEINNARKESLLNQESLNTIFERKIETISYKLEKTKKIDLSLRFIECGYSQRKTAEILGLSRDTIRKYTSIIK